MTPPSPVGHRDHRVVLDVELLLVADAVLALEDEVGRREGRVRVADGHLVGGELTWSDATGSKTGGSGSVRTVIACRAARSVARSGAARSASGSAWCWISPPIGTRIGWSSLIELTMLSPGMSAAVTTMTVDQSKAGSRSSATNRACASVERIVAPNQAPGKDQVVGVLRGAGELGRALAPERRSSAGPAGHDRPGLDDDRRGRLGPRRQVGHGPSSMATDSITRCGQVFPQSRP